MSAIPTLSLSLSFPVLYAFFFAVTVAHPVLKKGEKRRQEQLNREEEIFRFFKKAGRRGEERKICL
jgi:hypothetical protein